MTITYSVAAGYDEQVIIDAIVDALAVDVGDFSAQSNLKSLLAVLGAGWNTDNKTLYAKLITDLLGHGTHGLAAIKAITDIRRIASGSKTLATGVTKYLSIDSGTNGAELIGILIKGVVSADWTLDIYVPAADAIAVPAAGDKRDTNAYVNVDTEGGMLTNFAIPYNCFLDFTNDSGGDDNIDDVVILYRSAGVLTLTWEA